MKGKFFRSSLLLFAFFSQIFHSPFIASSAYETNSYTLLGKLSWSPDGGQIAFEYYTQLDESSIWVINTDGSGPKNLTPNQDHAISPKWSPNGQFIAFSDGSDLWVMNADGSNQNKLTSGFQYVDTFFQWSPNSKFILFTGYLQDGETKLGTISLVKPDGSDLRRLTPKKPTQMDYLPSWSPDSQQIIFTDFDNDSKLFEIRIQDINSEDSELFISGLSFAATWSPNPDLVAALSLEECTNGFDVITISISTLQILNLTSNECTALLSLPQWSPNGQFLIYEFEDNDDISKFGVFDLSKGDLVYETQGLDPAWSPDNQQIAFNAFDNGRSSIWIIDLNTLTIENITKDLE